MSRYDREPSPANRDPAMFDRKKGLMRVFELMNRDGMKFFKAGVLAVVGLIPFMAVILLTLVAENPLVLLGLIPAGMLAGPEMCGLADTIMRSMRDEIGWWWWDTYKTAWKRNARSSVLPGAIFGVLAGTQIYSIYIVALLPNQVEEFWGLFAAMMVELGVFSFYMPMLACMELPFGTLVRNCFVLFFNHPIKSLLSAFVQLLYFGLMLVWFPLTSILVLVSFWMPILWSYSILYPALDKHFGLTKAYEDLQKAQWGVEEEPAIEEKTAEEK